MGLKRSSWTGLAFLVLTAASMVLTGCAMFRQRPHPEVTSLEQVKKQIHVGAPTPLKAGVSKVDITPSVGTPLAGYSKRKGRPSQGVRDPVFVRALALNDGEDQVVLVSADLLIFPQSLADEIISRAAAQFKLPRQAILLTATHTHSGTGAIASGVFYEMVFGSYDSEIVEGLMGRVLWAIQQALERQQPVRWGVAVDDRLLLGVVENRISPGTGEINPSLGVLFLETLDRKPFAAWVTASAHPTLMDSKDMRFSADYPGELTRQMESTYPGLVCLFANGTAGDTRPMDAIGSNPDERIVRFGQLLAEGATGLVSTLPLKERADLAAWGWIIDLPAPRIRLGMVPIHPVLGSMFWPHTVAGLNLLSMDDILWIGLPAEPTVAAGMYLQRELQAPGKNLFLLSYANGYQGYVVTSEQYAQGSYEASMTWYGPDFSDRLRDRLIELSALYPSEKKK